MKPRLLLLFLPAMMGTWALAGLVREAAGVAPEPWRMAFHGLAFLVFTGLAVALMRSMRRRPDGSGDA